MNKKTLCALLGLLAACAAPEAEDPTNFAMKAEIVVTAGPQQPLPNVDLALVGQNVAKTDDGGRAALSLRGTEGDALDVAVQCPAGYASPAPVRVVLRKLSPQSPPVRFSAACSPLEHLTVVGIRAENGANLPVQRLGKVVGRTDASGVAHIVVRAKADEQISLLLDTSGADGKAPLRPRSPALTFVTKDHDDFVVLEQKFVQERPIVRPGPARPRGPSRL